MPPAWRKRFRNQITHLIGDGASHPLPHFVAGLQYLLSLRRYVERECEIFLMLTRASRGAELNLSGPRCMVARSLASDQNAK
jgi:hypothetical protein